MSAAASSASPAPPAAVVFDVGNVLVNWDPDRVYAPLLPDPEARRALMERVDLAGMNLRGDAGRLQEAVAETAAAHPQDAALIQAWWDRWSEMFAPAIDGSFALMARLKAQGVTVLGLTNFAADSWVRGCEIYPGLRDFDDVIVSGEEGVLKPDEGIYRILEARSGLSGAQLFFADDKAENIAAARALGWRGHVFTTPEGLVAALRAEGLEA